MNNKTTQAIKVSALALVLSLGIGYALAWTAPTATPPAGNVSAPINTSATAQTKAGPLTLNGLLTSAGVTLTGTSRITFQNLTTLSSAPMQIRLFEATPSTIQSGMTSTISWQVLNLPVSPATPCTLGKIGEVQPAVGAASAIVAGPFTGPANYTYKLYCLNPADGTSITQSITLNVLAPFSRSFSNGQSDTVNIPYGVTKLTFSGSGGNGGRGYYSGVGGAGGTMALNDAHGKGIDSGTNGGTTLSSRAGNGGAGGFSGGIGGWPTQNGAVGANCAVGYGGRGVASYGSLVAGDTNGGGVYPVGNGQSAGGGGGGAFVVIGGYHILELGGGGGGAGYVYGGGGGGGLGGGGGGGATCAVAGGGGGGGGGFVEPDFTAPVSGVRSILLSQIGNGLLVAPLSMHIGTGAGGSTAPGGAYNGTGGTLTVSW